MRPSDTWKTVAQLVDVPYSAADVWPTLPLDAIERLATGMRSPHVRCVANREKYASGQFNVAIELVFDDGVVWIARIWTNHYEPTRPSAEVISRRLRCEVATLKLVMARTTIPVPTVFAFSDTADNALGWPYVFMSPLPGRCAQDIGITFPLQCCPIASENSALFETYCASLADIHLQLADISFDQIGSVYFDASDLDAFVIGPEVDTGIMPCASVAEFYAAYCDKLLKDLLATVKPEAQDDALFGLWIYCLLVSTLSRSRDPSGSFRLCHRDLHGKNTLIDEDGTIVGVLDWDFAACMPIEIVAADVSNFLKDIHRENIDPHMREAYNRALRHAEDARNSRGIGPKTVLSGHTLSGLHASTAAQLLNEINSLIPQHWSSRYVWEMMCVHLFGTKEWAPFRESPIFLEWCTTQRARATSLR